MSGQLVAQLDVHRFEDSWLPVGSPPPPPEAQDASHWCCREFRQRLFEAMHQQDPDFPLSVRWLLEAIHVTGVEVQGEAAMCTVILPLIQYEEGCADQEELDCLQRFFSWRSDYEEYRDVSRQVVIGRWSDPGSMAVGLFLSSTQDQRQCIARGLGKLSVCMLDGNSGALDHVLQMIRSPRLSVANCFKDYPYKGTEYDTSLLHGLMTDGKRWNYFALLEILHTLMSRADVDFSSEGWSWQKRETVSGRQLAFFEWCLIAGGSRRRQLWIDPALPRLYSLAISIHLPACEEAPRQARQEKVVANLLRLMDSEPLFYKQRRRLRKSLASDLAALAETLPLPCGALTPEDIGGALDLLSELF